MNREVYEVNDDYCAVMDDNGKIKLLTKQDNSHDFSDLLDLENKLEAYVNSRDENEKRINELSGWKAVKKDVKKLAVCGFFCGLLTSLGGMLVTSVFSTAILPVGLFGAGIGMATTLVDFIPRRLRELRERDILKHDLTFINGKIKKLAENIDKVKTTIKVKDIISPSIFNKKMTDQYVKAINSDKETMQNVEDRNFRILRSYVSDYLNNENIVQESSRQYTIKRR